MPSNFQEQFQRELGARLRELAAREQRRSLVEIQGTNLCSNDYLELSRHPALKEAVERVVRPPTVPPGSARLRFSLTSGISDDELLRLENSLNNWREHVHSSAVVARA